MKRTTTRRALAATAALAAAALAWAGGLTPQEERGKRIYRTGISPRGTEIVAVTAQGTIEMSAAALPCVGCHGRDGRGRPEGAVYPSDLTREALTKPYGVTHPGGRTHPPYTERLLKRAITLGIDPAGNALHVVMPRYRMSHEDMADLLAYLQRLGHEPEPGVSESALRIGTLLPEGPTGETVRALLGAFFAEVNARGGVYGRQIELTAIAPAGSAAERRAKLAELLDREPLFALVGAFLGGADRELAPLFLERELPVVGAMGSRPPSGATNPFVFYLLSGLEAQSRALVELTAREAGATPVRLAVVAREDPDFASLAEVVEVAARERGWTVARSLRYPPGSLDAETARALHGSGADLLFFAGPGADLGRLLAAADAIGWRPRVLTPGPLAVADLFAAPRSFDRRLFLAFPTLPGDQSPAAMADYERLAKAAGLPRRDLGAQLTALAAARLLVDALNRAGRDLTRDGLIARLEKTDRFDTGLLPPLTYNAGRRVGALGAYVVTVDLEKKTFVPASGWIEVGFPPDRPAAPL